MSTYQHIHLGIIWQHLATSGKLAAVMHVAVILQDCLACHTVIVLAKPCASILSPNMMRMKLDMIMRMNVIIRRKRGVRENG